MSTTLRPISRPVAAFLIALALLGAALVLRQPTPNGDEPHYALEAVSIARDGDRDLANQYDDPVLDQQIYGANALEPHAYRFPGGHGLVSVHGPGLPLLLAPVAAVTTRTMWMRLEIVAIAALAAALLMALLERVPFGASWQRWAAWAAVVLSAPIVVYSSALYPETPAIALTLAAAVLLTRARPGPGALAAAAACAGALPWLNVRFLSVTIVLALVGVWRAWGHPRRGAALAGAIAPLVVLGLAFAAGFAHWYGSPWPSAQYQLSDSPRSLSGTFRFGVGGLFSAEYGWLPKAPVHLLGLVAIGLFVRRLGRPALIVVLGAAFYMLVIGASGVGFPGSSYAGRQEIVLMPLVAAPILVLLATARRWWWAAFGVLALASLALTAQAIRDQGQVRAPAPGSLAARYDSLWPDYSVAGQVQRNWTGDPARMRRDVGYVTRTGALPDQAAASMPAVASAAPAGVRGVLERFTTPVAPPDAYSAGVLLRADAPSAVPVAQIDVRDDGGAVLAAQVVRGVALPPSVGYRAFLLPYHLPRAGRMTLTVRTTGATGLRASAVQVINQPGASLAGTSGFPGLGPTIAWVAGLAAIAAALVLYDRSRGRTARA